MIVIFVAFVIMMLIFLPIIINESKETNHKNNRKKFFKIYNEVNNEIDDLLDSMMKGEYNLDLVKNLIDHKKVLHNRAFKRSDFKSEDLEWINIFRENWKINFPELLKSDIRNDKLKKLGI